MHDVIDMTDGRLRLIARTESTAVSNTARINSYKKTDPEGKARYVWYGPNDYRTTQRCKNIMRRTRAGVKLDKLIQIVKEEANKWDKDFTVDPNHLTAGYNCRHTILRKV